MLFQLGADVPASRKLQTINIGIGMLNISNL